MSIKQYGIQKIPDKIKEYVCSFVFNLNSTDIKDTSDFSPLKFGVQCVPGIFFPFLSYLYFKRCSVGIPEQHNTFIPHAPNIYV
jgi:hypothetical protein